MSGSVLICCLVAALAAVAASQITPEDTSTLVTPPDFFVNNTGATTTIKFGCMLPFSGDNVIKGYAARNGIMMAMTDAAKKYPKYSFQLICRDTVCKSDFSPAAAQALKDAKVVAALGDVCSGGSLAAKDTLAPTLLISPSATSNLLTNDTDNFLRTVAPDKFQSLVLSTLVRGNTTAIPKPLPVVVVYENNTYGTGLAAGFSDAYRKAGGRIVFNTTVLPDNAKSTVQDLATKKARRIVIATNNVTWVAEFLAEGAKIATFRPTLFAGDAQLDPSIPIKVTNFSGTPALLNKLSVTAYNQGTAAFRAKYAAFTKGAPYVGNAAHAYDAFNVLMQGYVADAAGGKPVATIGIATPLKASFQGVGGFVKFDSSGDLIPDNTAYQSIRYVAGKVVYGPFLALPAK